MIVMALACKKLDLKPYDKVERKESFKTIKDASYWNTGVYALLKPNTYGLYVIAQDVQADQLNATLNFNNTMSNQHTWSNSFNADDPVIKETWKSYYAALNNSNATLEGYALLVPQSNAETDSLKKYIGTAYLSRAYYLYNLALRFAKAYNPANLTEMGIPLTLSFDVLNKPHRATIKETYDQIVSDVNLAVANLAHIKGLAGASRFTAHAAKALEARVKLDIQDYAGAYKAATEIIASGTYPLYRSTATLSDYWAKDYSQEDITQLYSSMANDNKTNNIYLDYNTGDQTYSPRYVPTQSILDLYEDSDIRKSVYFQTKRVLIQGKIYDNSIYLVNKYPGNPELFSGTVSNYQHKVKLFRIAEQYLIAAEAAYFNQGDETNARKYLNELREARGLAAVNASGGALLQEIKNERQRELAFDGFRLFDLKRWAEGVQRGLPQNPGILVAVPEEEYTKLKRPYNDEKMIWGLPTNDILTNANLIQNPGW